MTDAQVTRTTLLDQMMPPDLVVSRVEVRRISIAPGVAGGAHRHNGAVFGSIETGSAILQISDGPERILNAGDVFYEPADVRITRFDATAEGVTFLGYFLLGPGIDPEIEFLGDGADSSTGD